MSEAGNETAVNDLESKATSASADGNNNNGDAAAAAADDALQNSCRQQQNEEREAPEASISVVPGAGGEATQNAATANDTNAESGDGSGKPDDDVKISTMIPTMTTTTTTSSSGGSTAAAPAANTANTTASTAKGSATTNSTKHIDGQLRSPPSKARHPPQMNAYPLAQAQGEW